MIKINFKSTKISSAAIYGNTKSSMASSEDLSSQINNFGAQIQEIIKSQFLDISFSTILLSLFKICLVFSFVLGLKGYEFQQVSIRNNKIEELQKSIESNQAEIKKLEAEIEKYKYLDEKEKEFKSKKEFIKKLAGSRLIVPKILDNIQTNIPNTIWLQSIRIKIEKEKSELHIKGESVTESHINSFSQSLSKIVVDSSQVKTGMTDVTKDEVGTIVSFNLSSPIKENRGF